MRAFLCDVNLDRCGYFCNISEILLSACFLLILELQEILWLEFRALDKSSELSLFHPIWLAQSDRC